MRTKGPLVVGALAAVVVVAGCGGGSDSTSTPTTPAAPTTTQPTSSMGVVSTDDNAKFGKILVGADGKTLYYFEKDKGGKSACFGACAKVWPPLLTTGKPTAERAAIASKLGTTKRKDGTVQVTYAGFPLYGYLKDTKPGDALGNNVDQFGAEWYALTPAGKKPEKKAAATPAGAGGGSSY